MNQYTTLRDVAKSIKLIPRGPKPPSQAEANKAAYKAMEEEKKKRQKKKKK